MREREIEREREREREREKSFVRNYQYISGCQTPYLAKHIHAFASLCQTGT